jgi:hypothetical protein
MTVFASPAAGGGSDVRPADLEGHLLVVEPQEYVASMPTAYGDKDAIRVTIHDITDATTYENMLWFPSVLVGSLKSRVGEKVLAVLGKGDAKPGQAPPWILVDAVPDPDCVQAATAYLDSIGASQADPEIEQVAKDSGNPALAAALNKLGARK